MYYKSIYLMVNLYIVFDKYVSPGSRTTFGNSSWFGESGKCWVSKHSPDLKLYFPVVLVFNVPFKKLPE